MSAASPPKLQRRTSYAGDLSPSPPKGGASPSKRSQHAGAAAGAAHALLGDDAEAAAGASSSKRSQNAGAAAAGGATKRRRRATFAEPPATEMRTFALSPSESQSKASLSRSIKQAVKRARGGGGGGGGGTERCAELAAMLPRMRELIGAADLRTYRLRELRETLEAETGTDLSRHKHDVKAEMQRLVGELSGGKLVAT